MANTVSKGVSQRPVTKETVLEALNREVVPVLKEAADALNIVQRNRVEISGATGTVVPWESDTLPSNCVFDIQARFIGEDLGERYHFTLSRGGHLTAGAVTWFSAGTSALMSSGIPWTTGLTPPLTAYTPATRKLRLEGVPTASATIYGYVDFMFYEL